MATIPVPNESEATHSRITKDGRKLTYELRVLQQPQRARACGSGAKSSSDRRPVDPPPVIELRVYEGEHRQDITFNHKANFFVYTTLETARSIAPMRGQPISQPPVLTGSPVSGAALLDRPSPAAYFIFPDLSVRHEGKYRLSFNLFEELKDAKDEDANPSMNSSHPLLGSSPMAPQAHVHFRLEVRSKPFIVYSAKKFPGLSESTSLSRVVAEQGCRVRIRRDVRMRRRDTKSGKDSGDHDDNSYPSYNEPASAELYRQPSLEQIQSQAQTPHQSVEQTYYSTPSYSTTNYSQHTQPQYVPQARSGSQQHYHSVHASPVEQSPIQTNAYPQSYSQYPQQPHTRHPSMSSNHDGSQHGSQYGGSQSQQQQQQSYQPSPYNGIQGHQDPAGIGAKSVFWNEQQNTAQGIAVDPYTMPQAQQQQQTPRTATVAEIRAATPNGTQLPPLKSLQPALRPDSQPHSKPQTPVQDIHHANSVSMPDIYGLNPSFNGYSSMTGSVSSIAANLRTGESGGKRGYDRVFDAGRSTGMTNGCRQDAVGQDVPQFMTEEGLITMEDLNMKSLIYRRANGTMQTRRITSPGDQ